MIYRYEVFAIFEFGSFFSLILHTVIDWRYFLGTSTAEDSILVVFDNFDVFCRRRSTEVLTCS